MINSKTIKNHFKRGEYLHLTKQTRMFYIPQLQEHPFTTIGTLPQLLEQKRATYFS